MKIPKFNDKDFTKCIECGRTNPPLYVSKKCLHKLCYRCHGLKFEFSDEYECQLCQAENKDNYFYKLNKDDFIENPLEDFYKKDISVENSNSYGKSIKIESTQNIQKDGIYGIRYYYKGEPAINEKIMIYILNVNNTIYKIRSRTINEQEEIQKIINSITLVKNN